MQSLYKNFSFLFVFSMNKLLFFKDFSGVKGCSYFVSKVCSFPIENPSLFVLNLNVLLVRRFFLSSLFLRLFIVLTLWDLNPFLPTQAFCANEPKEENPSYFYYYLGAAVVVVGVLAIVLYFCYKPDADTPDFSREMLLIKPSISVQAYEDASGSIRVWSPLTKEFLNRFYVSIDEDIVDAILEDSRAPRKYELVNRLYNQCFNYYTPRNLFKQGEFVVEQLPKDIVPAIYDSIFYIGFENDVVIRSAIPLRVADIIDEHVILNYENYFPELSDSFAALFLT